MFRGEPTVKAPHNGRISAGAEGDKGRRAVIDPGAHWIPLVEGTATEGCVSRVQIRRGTTGVHRQRQPEAYAFAHLRRGCGMRGFLCGDG